MTVLVNQLIRDGLERSAITLPVIGPDGAAIHHRITHPDAVAPAHRVSTACVSINNSNHQ